MWMPIYVDLSCFKAVAGLEMVLSYVISAWGWTASCDARASSGCHTC